MKFALALGALVMLGMFATTHAKGQSLEARQGTIVSVQKKDIATPPVRAGANPDRTPLQTHYYSYDISVQVGCGLYVGRYESELDDLPNGLAPNTAVPVRVQKRLMYLDFPGDSVKTRIVSNKSKGQESCAQTSAN